VISTLQALYVIDMWSQLSLIEQDRLIEWLAIKMSDDFEHIETNVVNSDSHFRSPLFRHRLSDLMFNLIIGGQFLMGLSDAEERTASGMFNKISDFTDNMKPAHIVHVKPFLISNMPILRGFAEKHLRINYKYVRPQAPNVRMKDVVMYLSRDETTILNLKFGFERPTEAQWEYAYRGGTSTLFYFGNSVPNDHVLENNILLRDFSDDSRNRSAVNPFGLVGMCAGTWCEDSFIPNYNNARHDDLPILGGPPFAVRAGGSHGWPWEFQHEWILCLSAYRTHSQNIDESLHGYFPTRVVKRLDDYLMQ
jgi:hypothetical protein